MRLIDDYRPEADDEGREVVAARVVVLPAPDGVEFLDTCHDDIGGNWHFPPRCP